MCPASLREMVAKLQYREEERSSLISERGDANTAKRRLEDSSDGVLFCFIVAVT